MQQKPMTISANEFNEKIKNNLRDYYVYQFKRFQNNSSSDYRKKGTDENKPASTFTEEKQRLLGILESHTQLRWTTEKGGVCYCAVDTRSLDKNPFWEPYRFCAASHKYLGWFLSMVLLLHPQVQLRDPQGIPEPIVPRFLQKLRPDAPVGMKAMSQEHLRSWLERQLDANYSNTKWGEFCLERFHVVHRQRINNRKMVLEDDPNCFGASVEFVQKYYAERGGSTDVKKDQRRNRLNDTCSGILRSNRVSPRKEQWRLSSNTLQPIRGNQDLRFRFQQMIGYFMQTLPLGFIGMRLQHRIGTHRNLIRYRHNYIINTLNDYNIVDLLHAIGHRQWIELEFRNGTNLLYQQAVCFPLQIRESILDGRQYLMYYHPGQRSLGSLRLDFIDRIHYVCVAEHPDHAEEITRAQQALGYVWGVSIPGFYQGNMKHPRSPAHIKLVFRRDTPEIQQRLLREARHGSITGVDERANTITYEVHTADPRAMIPWFRSYAAHILEIRVDGEKVLPLTSDPAAAFRRKLDEWVQTYEDSLGSSDPGNEDVSCQRLKHPEYPHEYLFNPLFSVAFDTVVQTVFGMMQQPDRFYSPDDLNMRIRDAWPEKTQLHEDMLELIYENITMLCSGNNRKGYRLDYIPTEEARRQCETLWDMIPLSDLEASYLKGILSHPKAALFLSQQEILQILSGLREDIDPVNFSAICYHDQYRDAAPGNISDPLRKNFSALLTSAAQGSEVEVVYAGQEETTSVHTTVVRLEYSKKEDRFWVCCADAGSHISFLDPEKFAAISPTGEKRDPEVLQMLSDQWTADTRRRLVLEFSDEKNRPERIATEFLPWEKICTIQDSGDVRYCRMELFYDVQDASEIAIRVLSYGKGICIVQDSGNVTDELSRLQKPVPSLT